MNQVSSETLLEEHGAPRIESAEAWLCDLPVETKRTDALQTFVKQETILVRVRTADGSEGTGYAYTIGTGGTAVLSLLRDTLLEQVIGLEVDRPEHVWTTCYGITRATMVGPITALALAAIDIAVWDVRLRHDHRALWRAAGGASRSVALYDTEGGWLHHSIRELVDHAVAAKDRGLQGVKIKVGLPNPCEDIARLAAVREALGDELDIMVDANQSFTLPEALRRVRSFEDLGIAWFEEPLPADDVAGHRRLAEATTVPVAVGESLYSVGQFREYLREGAASVIQVDAARIGGITPWLKVAHLAEAFGVTVAPHFLMELHAPLAAGVQAGGYVEHIPQLRAVTHSELRIEDGRAWAPDVPGVGISWDLDALAAARVDR